MDKKRIYRALIFLVLGAVLFWWIYKDTDFTFLKNQVAKFNLFWIGVSIILNLMSQLVRAHRWKTLFQPLGYSPKFVNLFLALLIMAFTNLIIPRGGEITRLIVINKNEKISFSKLLGIALTERLTDLVLLILIFIGVFIAYLPLIEQLINSDAFVLKQVDLIKYLVIFTIIIGLLVMAFLIIKNNSFKRIKRKINEIKKDIKTGVKSIFKVKNKTLYLLDSILIYILWLSMFYVLFLAYPPTQKLSLTALVFTFGLATFAFLLPIQAGIGAWHFMVIQCLLLFGVDMDEGKAFSLVAHAVTNFIYLFLGGIAFLLIPLLNRAPFSEKSDKQN